MITQRPDNLSARDVARKAGTLVSACKTAVQRGVGTYIFNEEKYSDYIVDFAVQTLKETARTVLVEKNKHQVMITVKP